MARAETAGSVGARYLPFGRLYPAARKSVSGHARLIARPAYQKLLAAEPLLKRLIPVLIVIFLSIVGLARFVELYQLKLDREHEARDMITMIASVLSAELDAAPSQQALSKMDLLNTLADALPPGATSDGR